MKAIFFFYVVFVDLFPPYVIAVGNGVNLKNLLLFGAADTYWGTSRWGVAGAACCAGVFFCCGKPFYLSWEGTSGSNQKVRVVVLV